MGQIKNIKLHIVTDIKGQQIVKEMESTEAVKKANVHDLYTIPLWVAFVLATRYLFERYLATPFCGLLGIKVVFKDVPSNDKPKDEMKNASLFRSRKDHSARQLLKKATETCWRFVFYTMMWSVGLYVILSNEWGTDYSAWMENFASYSNSLYRFGVIIMFLHDCANVF